MTTQKELLFIRAVVSFISLCTVSALDLMEIWDTSVIALGYGLDDLGVRVPAGAGNFPPHHRVQTDSGAHPSSYIMITRDFSPGGKATGA
jgi:hypothetical protein